jgi:hypothetical protein
MDCLYPASKQVYKISIFFLDIPWVPKHLPAIPEQNIKVKINFIDNPIKYIIYKNLIMKGKHK